MASVSKRIEVVVVSIAVVATAFALDACSSSDDPPAVERDDASAPSTNDGAIALENAEVRCDPDASLLERVADAAILDGASTTGICAGCLDERCAYELARCAEDCMCQAIVGDALQCYLTTQQLACLGRLTDYLVRQDTRGRALQLSGCARSSCASACAVDGGADASSD